MKSAKDIKTWLDEQRDLAISETDKILKRNFEKEGDMKRGYQLTGEMDLIERFKNYEREG